MKYRILMNEALTPRQKRRNIIKWLLFSLILLLLYVIMRAGVFGHWQPVLIIPLAVAVAMNESELSVGIFALFCGYLIDIACGFIFGFSVVWLMPVCVAATLLVKNLIRRNLFNFVVITVAAVIIQFSMDYLFNIAIWNIPGGEVIFYSSMLPAAISTIILSPSMYYLVKLLNNKLSPSGIEAGYTPDVQETTDNEQTD